MSSVEDAIRAMVDWETRAWDRQDAEALGSLFRSVRLARLLQ